MRRFKVTPLDAVLLVLSAAMAVGLKLVFHACGQHEDGSWGVCNWAEQAVFALYLVLGLQSLIAAFSYSRRMKIGASAAMVPTALMAAAIPGVLIDLCGDAAMRCHTFFRPAVWAGSGLIAVLALVHAIRQYQHVIRRERG